MNLKTTGLLVVLLALLGAAIWWQTRSEERDRAVEVLLFGGADPQLVDTIRVENISRGYNMRLERDSSGRWFITDPFRYPADRASVRALLEDVGGARGLVPGEERWTDAELGFDPPRIVIEVDERRPEGSRTHRVEIGAPDLDRVRLNLRVDGRHLRALVRLYTTLDHILDDFRSRRAMTVTGDEVLEVHRVGKVQFEVEEEQQDLELHAIRDGAAWRATSPWRALLAGLDVGIVVYGASRLRVQRFVEDEGAELGDYGLDYPLARIDLVTRERTEVLLLGRKGMGGAWFAKRQDAPYVWSIDPESALRLLYPTEAMVDRHFMRARRQDVAGLRLDPGAGAEVLLERAGEAWRVSAGGPPLPADARRVGDELARLEALELGHLDQALRAELFARPPVLPMEIRVEVGGESLGGRLGRAPGGELVFQRPGDDLFLLAPDWLAELAATPAVEFRSKQLLDLVENRLTRLRIAGAAGERAFTRDGRGLWHPEGEEREAEELLALLDPLIFLKAEGYPESAPELEAPLELVFEDFEGGETRLRIGAGTLDGRPASLVEMGGVVAELQRAELHGELVALLGS